MPSEEVEAAAQPTALSQRPIVLGTQTALTEGHAVPIRRREAQADRMVLPRMTEPLDISSNSEKARQIRRSRARGTGSHRDPHTIVEVRSGWGDSTFPPGRTRDTTNAMNASIGDTTKRNRKPRAQAPGTPVVVRLQPNLLAGLDTLAGTLPGVPSRPEVIRQILADHLREKGYLA